MSDIYVRRILFLTVRWAKAPCCCERLLCWAKAMAPGFYLGFWVPGGSNYVSPF